MNNRKIVIGLGNILLKDEGAGVRCIEYLRAKHGGEGLALVEGATFGFDLLEEIKGYARAVIVDAVDMGKEPGFVASLSAAEVLRLPGSQKFSLHEIGLVEVLQVGQNLGHDFSGVTIVGIQPQAISRGDELSDAVAKNLPRLAEKVLEEIDSRPEF